MHAGSNERALSFLSGRAPERTARTGHAGRGRVKVITSILISGKPKCHNNYELIGSLGEFLFSFFFLTLRAGSENKRETSGKLVWCNSAEKKVKMFGLLATIAPCATKPNGRSLLAVIELDTLATAPVILSMIWWCT